MQLRRNAIKRVNHALSRVSINERGENYRTLHGMVDDINDTREAFYSGHFVDQIRLYFTRETRSMRPSCNGCGKILKSPPIGIPFKSLYVWYDADESRRYAAIDGLLEP